MKNIFYTGILLLSGLAVFAQNDTIWLNSYLEKTTEDKAKYYRILTKNLNGTFGVKEYYKSGELYLEGTATSEEARNFEGKVLNYAKDGFMFYEVEYENQTPRIINSYLPNGETFFYEFHDKENGSGTVAYYTGKNDLVSIAEYQSKGNYVFKNYRFDDKLNKILLTHQIYQNAVPVKAISYDTEGKLIGECSYKSYLPQDGIVTEYYWENVKIKSKIEYSDGKIINEESYFPSGKLKKNIKTEGDTETSVFYDKTGKKIGTYIREEVDKYYSENRNGVLVEYDYQEGKEDDIYSISEYENGILKKETLYDYDDNSKYSVMYYADDFRLEKTENYENNTLVNTTKYDKNGNILDGVESYDKHTKNIYKDGKLVSGIKTYSNGKTFSERKDTEEVFYDQNGKEMGRVTYKDTYNDGYPIPYSGKLYRMYNDKITEYSVYKDGKMTESTFWDYRYSEPYNLYKKTVYGYPTPYGNTDISEEIHYYENGKISSHITYEGYYLKTKGEFYDQSGKLLATMDYRTQNGTEYTFFEDGTIEKIITYKNGEITYEELFARKYSYDSYSYDYVPVRKIDYNKEGIFYFGDEEFKAEYKDGKPYNGKVVNTDYSSYSLTPYQNGEINGEVIYYDSYNNEMTKKETYVNGKRTGKISEYRYGNVLILEKEIDENNNTHGMYREYSEDGELIKDLIYEKGRIISGYEMTSGYYYYDKDSYTKTTYENGKAVQVLNFKDGRMTSKSQQVVSDIYDEEYYYADGKKKLVYQTDKGYVSGTVSYFSESGKELHKAEFKDGQFVSGVALFRNTSSYKKDEYEYLKCIKTKNGYKLTGYDSKGKELFEITENLKNKQTQSVLLQKMASTGVSSYYLYGFSSKSDYDYDNYYNDYKNDEAIQIIDVAPPVVKEED